MADFIFADDYRLDESPTRNFYELFLKGLVHKHNNLMGVIQGFSSLILYDDDISSEVRDCAQQMQDSSKVASDFESGSAHFRWLRSMRTSRRIRGRAWRFLDR